MTARDLHRLFARTEPTDYAGGRDGFDVSSRRGDVHLTVSWDGGAHSMWLSDEDVDDLMLALINAQAARERYRNSTEGKAA